MKKFLAYFLYTLLLGAIVCACSNSLDVNQVYSYDLVYLPVQKKIVQGETVEIRCQLTKEGQYEQAAYTIRYFQQEGEGQLVLNNTVLSVNERYPLNGNTFSLYYTSLCAEQQAFDVYIEDNFGQTVQKSFSFQHENVKEETPVSTKYIFETLPVPSAILTNDTVEIRCRIVKEDEKNTAAYAIRYFQSSGKGKIVLDNTVLKQNDLYELNSESFSLYYVSNCAERQVFDVYVLDSNGQTVQKTFTFENEYVEPEPEIDFSFSFETLPVPKAVIEGETVEIRCHIKRADSRNHTNYYIRYFQPDGKGVLRFEYGAALSPNDLYYMKYDTFRLYYTSNCSEQQTIDIYIVDDAGRIVQKSFSFQNEVKAEEEI